MYIINEYQTDLNNHTAIVTPATEADAKNALSVFYTRCASAAVSAVPYHTVTLEYHNGNQIKCELFEHLPEPAEE